MKNTKLQVVSFVEMGWGNIVDVGSQALNEIIDSIVEDVNSGEIANEVELSFVIHTEMEQYIDDLQYI